jgi:hypothetical protein
MLPAFVATAGSVPVHGLLVESVDAGCLGRSSRGGDLLGHRVDCGKRATREEDACSFARERAGSRAADRAPAPSITAFLLSSIISNVPFAGSRP